MRVIKHDDVIDVIYDGWYNLPLDKADEVIYDYTRGKLISVEWIREWEKENWELECNYGIDDMIEEWEKMINEI